VIDGDLKTRWASSANEPKSAVTVDLGSEAVVSSVAINWERAFAKSFALEASEDGKTFREVAAVKDGVGGRQTVNLEPAIRARFLKIVAVEKVNPDWGISIWEIETYGPKADNPGAKLLKETFPELAKQLEAPQEIPRESPIPSPGALTLQEYQKGVVLASYNDAEFASADCDRMIGYLKGLGVNSVSLIVTWYQEKQDSPKIMPIIQGGNTAREEAVIHAINECHKNGIKVMLKPHVDCLDGTFRGDIIASEAWFKSYQEFIVHFAGLAQEYHVELFCIGTELENVSFDQWQKEWEHVIAEVRKAYKGKITYAANWTEYETVCFWDGMDFVGIDAYFPVTNKNDPSQAELDAGWEATLSKLAAWRANKKVASPVIFTEIGYQSADGTNRTPWQTDATQEDQQEQAMALEAVFNTTAGKEWFKGLYWWNYFPTDVQRPLDFTIKGKKAEDVLKDRFKTTQGG
jgi:hypothetical protein